MLQYEIKITGRVQGVGYRYFVQRIAAGLNIDGWVRNTYDGGVLVMAKGEKADIETFLDHLRLGPPLARITNIIKQDIVVDESLKGFRIKY
jgi:acylphosphatase